MADCTIDELVEQMHELRLRSRRQNEDVIAIKADLDLFQPIIDAAYEWHDLTDLMLHSGAKPSEIAMLEQRRLQVLDRLFDAVATKKATEHGS